MSTFIIDTEKVVKSLAEINGVGSRGIDGTAFRYRVLASMNTSIEKWMKEEKAKLLTYFKRYGNSESIEGLTVYATAPRKTLDKKALEKFLNEHGATIGDFEKEGSPGVSVRITNKVVL